MAWLIVVSREALCDFPLTFDIRYFQKWIIKDFQFCYWHNVATSSMLFDFLCANCGRRRSTMKRAVAFFFSSSLGEEVPFGSFGSSFPLPPVVKRPVLTFCPRFASFFCPFFLFPFYYCPQKCLFLHSLPATRTGTVYLYYCFPQHQRYGVQEEPASHWGHYKVEKSSLNKFEKK